MTHILDYIVSVNICLLVFFVFYYLVLAREKFFKLNRFFLLAAVLFSFIIPSIDIEIQKDEILETQIISKPVLLAEKFIPEEVLKEKITKPSINKSEEPKELTVTVEHTSLKNNPINTTANDQILTTTLSTDQALSQEKETNSSWEIELWQVLVGVYALGAILLITRTFKDVYFLLKTGLTSENSIQNGYRLVNTEGRLPTLSFFKFLFWDNSVKLDKTQKEQIIQHELAHIKQWHTIDVLFMEFLCILFWYNPTVYLFRRSIKEVHEYLADAAVLQSNCPNTYAKLLLSQVLGSPQLLLSNHFMQAQIKKRITMMTQTNSRHSILWKYLLVIPILAGMIISFARLSEVPSDETRTMQASLLSGELNTLENAFLFFSNSSEEEQKKKEAIAEAERIALETKAINIEKEKNIALDLERVTLSNQEAVLLYAQNNAYLEHLTESSFNDFRVLYDSTDRKKGKRTIVWVKKGKKYELNFDGDDIEKLEIDGKEIPKKDYEKHINIIEKAKNNNFVFISDGDVEDIDINFDGDFEGLAKLESLAELESLKELGKIKVLSFNCEDDCKHDDKDCDSDCEDDCKHDDKNCDRTKITINGKTMTFSADDKEKWEKLGKEMEDWGEKFGEELAANLEESFSFAWIDDEATHDKKHKNHKHYKKRKNQKVIHINNSNGNKNNIKLKVIEEREEQRAEFEKERKEQREELNKQREEQRVELEKEREHLRKEQEKQRAELQKQREELQKQREELQKQREELRKEKKNDN